MQHYNARATKIKEVNIYSEALVIIINQKSILIDDVCRQRFIKMITKVSDL